MLSGAWKVFIFRNGGRPRIYLGAADWMNGNISYHIEMYCPLYNEKIKDELLELIEFQAVDQRNWTAVDHPENRWDKKSNIKTADAQTEV